MLNLTDSAVLKMKELLQQVNQTSHGIRLFMSPGGWRPSLAMGVAPNAEDGDETITRDGLKLFLEREANKMLSNATIDFSELQGFSLEGAEQSPCQSNACPTSSGCH